MRITARQHQRAQGTAIHQRAPSGPGPCGLRSTRASLHRFLERLGPSRGGGEISHLRAPGLGVWDPRVVGSEGAEAPSSRSAGRAGGAGRLLGSAQNSEFLFGGKRAEGCGQEEWKPQRPGCGVRPEGDPLLRGARAQTHPSRGRRACGVPKGSCRLDLVSWNLPRSVPQLCFLSMVLKAKFQAAHLWKTFSSQAWPHPIHSA